jgi:hypothetical protein
MLTFFAFVNVYFLPLRHKAGIGSYTTVCLPPFEYAQHIYKHHWLEKTLCVIILYDFYKKVKCFFTKNIYYFCGYLQTTICCIVPAIPTLFFLFSFLINTHSDSPIAQMQQFIIHIFNRN